MTNPYASSFTARDAISTVTSRNGSAPVPDPTGTSPKPTTSGIDPADLARFNAGVRKAALADWNECADCGRTFADRSALGSHRTTVHRRPKDNPLHVVRKTERGPVPTWGSAGPAN